MIESQRVVKGFYFSLGSSILMIGAVCVPTQDAAAQETAISGAQCSIIAGTCKFENGKPLLPVLKSTTVRTFRVDCAEAKNCITKCRAQYAAFLAGLILGPQPSPFFIPPNCTDLMLDGYYLKKVFSLKTCLALPDISSSDGACGPETFEESYEPLDQPLSIGEGSDDSYTGVGEESGF